MNSLAKTYWFSAFCVAFILLMSMDTIAADKHSAAKTTRLFLGTYTGGKSKGIYSCSLDMATGKLSAPELAGEVESPSFLALHPNGKWLYAVGEVDNFQGQKSGGVSAFSIGSAGHLSLINQQPSKGAGPCYLVVDRDGHDVLVANYTGGSVAVLPIKSNGALDPASAFVQHHGSSVNQDRQKEPHAHSINLDRANRFAFAADLGLDKILVYHFDSTQGSLVPNDPPSVSVAAGSGPRHFAFHPNGKFAYVINEMLCTVTGFTYEADRGVLKGVETLSTLPAGENVRPEYSTTEVQVHPSGRFLYGSNRGHDTIVVFAINPQTGHLTYVENQSTQGKTPRSFGIDPTGTYLLAANQDSDSVVAFRIDTTTGKLTPTGSTIEVGKPVCVKFVSSK